MGSSPSIPRAPIGLIDCPICKMTLTDPRIFPCGHSLCGPESEGKCLNNLERTQKKRGEIECPVCRRIHHVRSENVPPPYGFKEMLERASKMRMCEKHDSELRFFCNTDKEELCDLCWSQKHKSHHVELIELTKLKKLTTPWKNRKLHELRDFCLRHVEGLNQGVDYLLERRQRYINTADLCLSLMRKESKINQQFQKEEIDRNDDGITEFELYLKHLKEESRKMKKDLAKLDDLTKQLRSLTLKTADELEKRHGEKGAGSNFGENPKEAIIAFGDDGNNQKFNKESNKWEEWKGMNCGWGFACVRINTNIFIIGGYRGGSDSKCIDLYNSENQEWSSGPTMNIARRCAAACFAAVESHVYVIGGYNSEGQELNSVERLSVTSEGQPVGGWQLMPPMKSRRSDCAATVVNDRLFVCGGFAEAGSKSTASVECLHLPTGQWSECRSMCDKRARHAIIAYKNEVFVFGGWDGNKLSSSEKYHLARNTWNIVPSMKEGRCHCGVAVLNDRIYLVGGDNETSVQIYYPESNSWSEGPQLTNYIGHRVNSVSW